MRVLLHCDSAAVRHTGAGRGALHQQPRGAARSHLLHRAAARPAKGTASLPLHLPCGAPPSPAPSFFALSMIFVVQSLTAFQS